MKTRPTDDLLEGYLASFRADFHRSDQFHWACEYVRGLLADVPRKNIETMARHLKSIDGDVGQALQNFIHKSPWDEQRPWRRHRTQLLRKIGHADAVVVFREVAFVKQGQHSVGVHRQYHPAAGEKLNCQIAVGAHYVSPTGHGPLLLRLYLPRSWIQQPARLDAAAVPEEHRSGVTKSGLAVRILAELLGERTPLGHVLGPASFAATAEWNEGLAANGFHPGPSYGDPVYSRPAPASRAPHVQQAARKTEEAWTSLRGQLGLDHFEGRSWRGFHHHACLVMVAAGFSV